MNKGLVIGILVVLAIAAIVVIATRHNSTGNAIANPNMQTASSASSSRSSDVGTPFASSPYYPYAYLISTDPLSSTAQEAITGFDLSHNINSDGTTTYTLTALEFGYVNQSYTLQPGQKLYFIERSMGDDDAASNTDYNLHDDFAIVVDSNGNIVQQG